MRDAQTNEDRMIRYGLLLLVAVATLSAARQPAPAQSSPPKNIRDYFLLLPDKYAGISRAERQNFLRRADPLIDIANGYMSYQEYAESTTTIALFKRPDKSYLVGISFSGSVLNKKTEDIEDISTLSLLRYDNGRWTDVTSDVLPVAVRKELLYELPREGTTIKVRRSDGTKVLDLLWRGDKFVLP
jgi:hypothetical protein